MKKFENDLNVLQQRLAEMGQLTRSMCEITVAGIQDRNRVVDQELESLEQRVDEMQTSIDGEAIRMLTVYGPVATDLRQLLVCTHVTSQLERIGDQTQNVAEALRLISSPPSQQLLPRLTEMSKLVLQMVDDALDAYFSGDPDKAQETRGHDDVVDALNDAVMKDLLTDEVLQEVLGGARDIADAIGQILIARSLERIADQATNICKEVIYVVRGDDVRHRKVTEVERQG